MASMVVPILIGIGGILTLIFLPGAAKIVGWGLVAAAIVVVLIKLKRFGKVEGAKGDAEAAKIRTAASLQAVPQKKKGLMSKIVAKQAGVKWKD